MDMNQLLYHHQIALIDALRPRPDRRNDVDLVAHYAKRIRTYRRLHGLNPYREIMDRSY